MVDVHHEIDWLTSQLIFRDPLDDFAGCVDCLHKWMVVHLRLCGEKPGGGWGKRRVSRPSWEPQRACQRHERHRLALARGVKRRGAGAPGATLRAPPVD